jgi:hypothetical protein
MSQQERATGRANPILDALERPAVTVAQHQREPDIGDRRERVDGAVVVDAGRERVQTFEHSDDPVDAAAVTALAIVERRGDRRFRRGTAHERMHDVAAAVQDRGGDARVRRDDEPGVVGRGPPTSAPGSPAWVR